MKSPIAFLLRACLIAGLAVCLLASAAGQLAGLHWGLELFSHFKVQLAAAALGLLVLGLLLRARLASGAALLLLLLNAHPLGPYLSGFLSSAEAVQPGLRVLTLNLHHQHADRQAIEAYLEREEPAFVLLTELPADGRGWLRGLEESYPHQAVESLSSVFDVALLSRWPLDQVVFDRQVAGYLPVLTARACPASDTEAPPATGDCLTIVGLHAANPLGNSPRRDRQLRLAAEKAALAPGGRVLMLGDLNTTPWAPIFGEVLEQGGLRDSAPGFAPRATWLSRNPLFGLPIDHVLLGTGLEPTARRVGPDLGSDHFPVVADFALRQSD